MREQKPIIFVCEGGEISLKTKTKLRKGTDNYYVLYFSGIDKTKVHIACIENLTMKQYEPINSKGICSVPDCFNICDEIKVTLITMDGDAKITSNAIFLYFK